MIATSAEFTTQTLAPARRWKSRVTVNFTDVFLDQSITAVALEDEITDELGQTIVDEAAQAITSGPNVLPSSYLNQIVNGRSGATYKWFQLGQSLLDGTSHPGPGSAEATTNEIGWYSRIPSSNGGTFPFAQKVSITFASRPVGGFTLVSDDKWQEWPVDYYTEFYSSGVLQSTYNVTDNNDIFSRQTLPATLLNIDEVRLYITKWSKVGTTAKITEFSTEVIQVFDDQDVVDWSVTEQRDITSSSSIPFGNITSNEMSLQLVNSRLITTAGQDFISPGFVVDENGERIDDGYGGFIFAVAGGQAPNYGYLSDELDQFITDERGERIFLSRVASSRIFDIGNTDSIYNGRLRPNNRVQVELGLRLPNGTYEYIPMGTGWTNDWNVPTGGVTASTNVRDRLALLSKTIMQGTDVIANETFAHLFELVLQDAGLSISEYEIDSELGTTLYNIPICWIDKGTHRSRLEVLAQGCGAVVFADRNGKIIVRALDYDRRTGAGSVQTYTRKDYSTKSVPVIYSNVSNSITATTSPLVAVPGQTVYDSVEAETIGASSTQTFTVFYQNKPVSGASASIDPAVAGVSISNTTYYSWGADIEVTNANGTPQDFNLLVTGTTYEVKGQVVVTAKDDDNIAEFGEQAFTVPQNPFLQKRALAQAIVDELLLTYNRVDKDTTLTFEPGGNPAIELGDLISAEDKYGQTDYYIVENEYRYNGGLSVKHRGRVG